MTKFVNVRTVGDEMFVTPSRKHRFLAAGFTLFGGILMLGMGVRHLLGTERLVMLGGGAICLAMGLFFLVSHRTVFLDRRKRVVAARWHVAGVSGEETQKVEGQSFRVERSRTKSDSGTTYHFTAFFGDLRLFKISEYQGGQDEAERVAKQMAKHVGTKFSGTRDSKGLRRAMKMEAKYAMMPLIFVAIMLGLAAVYAVFFL